MSWDQASIAEALAPLQTAAAEASLFCGDQAVRIDGTAAWWQEAARDWEMMVGSTQAVAVDAEQARRLRVASAIGVRLQALCHQTESDFCILELLRANDNFDSRFRLGPRVNLTEIIGCLLDYQDQYKSAWVQCNWGGAGPDGHYRIVVMW